MKGNFQIIILVVFIAAAVFGVLVFSGAIPIGKSANPGAQGTVVLWGTIDNAAIAPLLETFNNENKSFVVQYVQKPVADFDQDLLEALASGTGPDMFFLPDDLAFHYADKITTIPYSSYPLSDFENNFASTSDIFLNSNGLSAFPMYIDPLVMYYNRSLLDASGVVYPPATWTDLANMVPTLTQKNSSGQITQSAVALGDFSNIAHAKDILAALFMQTGNPIVSLDQNGVAHSSLNNSSAQTNLVPVLSFYTNFSNPLQPVYSWNKSFPSSDQAFSQGKLAFYFGYASELQNLINTNPNENMLVAPFPQIQGSSSKLTEAHVTGLAISSASKNFNTAFTAASLMATGDFASGLASALGVAPARRDLLANKPTSDVYSPTFYDSALYAQSWLDPSPTDTDNVFSKMIESVIANSATPADALQTASSELDLLLQRQ